MGGRYWLWIAALSAIGCAGTTATEAPSAPAAADVAPDASQPPDGLASVDTAADTTPEGIGPEGGRVLLPGGGWLEIPPGALVERVVITAALVAPPAAAPFSPLVDFYAFSPEGLDLLLAGHLFVPLPATAPEDPEAVGLVFRDAAGDFVAMPSLPDGAGAYRVGALRRLDRAGIAVIKSKYGACCAPSGCDLGVAETCTGTFLGRLVPCSEADCGLGCCGRAGDLFYSEACDGAPLELSACRLACCAGPAPDPGGVLGRVAPAGACLAPAEVLGAPSGCRLVCCPQPDRRTFAAVCGVEDPAEATASCPVCCAAPPFAPVAPAECSAPDPTGRACQPVCCAGGDYVPRGACAEPLPADACKGCVDPAACDDGDPCTDDGCTPDGDACQHLAVTAGICGDGCFVPAAEDCEQDTDCAELLVCQGCACVEPPECAADEPCVDPVAGDCWVPACVDGACVSGAAPVGIACHVEDLCAIGGSCGDGGVCLVNPKSCTAPPTSCHASPGTCVGATGECAYAPLGDCVADADCAALGAGFRCVACGCRAPDGTCQADADCKDADPSDCMARACVDKKCVAAPAPFGSACADPSKPCGVDGACDLQGLCQTQTKACDAPDFPACMQNPGACNEVTGVCEYPWLGNCLFDFNCAFLGEDYRCVGCTCVALGGPCAKDADCGDSGFQCRLDACVDGACTLLDGAPGTPCDDGDLCTEDDGCGGGECHGVPRVCVGGPGGCFQEPGVCSPATGQCTFPPIGDCLTDGDCAFLGAAAQCIECQCDADPGAGDLVVLGMAGAVIPNGSVPALADGTDFGDVPLGEEVVRGFTLRNDGEGELQLASVAVYGPAPADFSLASGPSVTTLLSGEQTVVQVALIPTQEGPVTGTVRIDSDDPFQEVMTFGLAANVIVSDLVVLGAGQIIPHGDSTPAAEDGTDFGKAVLAAAPVARTFTLRNDGPAPLVLPAGAVTVSGPAAAEYALAAPVGPLVLQTGQTAPVDLVFTPTAAGFRAALISVQSNDPYEAPYRFTVVGRARPDLVVERRLEGANPSLSDDGKVMAFERGADVRVFVDGVGLALVSATPGGGTSATPDAVSHSPAVSGDGTTVAFASDAGDLVAGDQNAETDVFLRNRVAGTTSRVSRPASGESNGPSLAPALGLSGTPVVFQTLASNIIPGDWLGGEEGVLWRAATGAFERINPTVFPSSQPNPDGPCGGRPALSADGLRVAFECEAKNIVFLNTPSGPSVYLYEAATHTVRLCSIAHNGWPPNGVSFQPAISADGAWVAFASLAGNITPGVLDEVVDVYVWSPDTELAEKVSVAHDGSTPDGDSHSPALSADGRFVVFVSGASNLVNDDLNGQDDIFLRDRSAGRTWRVSMGLDGEDPDGPSWAPVIAAKAPFVAFQSAATNLSNLDDNGGTIDVFLVRLPPAVTDP